MHGQTFIFVENFHVNNLSVVLEIFHVFNFYETRVPMKIRTFPDLRYITFCVPNLMEMEI